jgi:hypothetical protein
MQGREAKGLYVIGLDNHVGFLLNGEEGVDFIHSSYAEPAQVIREEAALSQVLSWSNVYVLGMITFNRPLLRKWLMGEAIETVRTR